jgi:hypothetical protein
VIDITEENLLEKINEKLSQLHDLASIEKIALAKRRNEYLDMVDIQSVISTYRVGVETISLIKFYNDNCMGEDLKEGEKSLDDIIESNQKLILELIKIPVEGQIPKTYEKMMREKIENDHKRICFTFNQMKNSFENAESFEKGELKRMIRTSQLISEDIGICNIYCRLFDCNKGDKIHSYEKEMGKMILWFNDFILKKL